MEIEELVKRIREKENPESAEKLISLINARGEGYANYLMRFYDDIHMKYDNVLYGESGRGVLIVEKMACMELLIRMVTRLYHVNLRSIWMYIMSGKKWVSLMNQLL